MTKYCTIWTEELISEDEFEEIDNSYKLIKRYCYDLIDPNK